MPTRGEFQYAYAGYIETTGYYGANILSLPLAGDYRGYAFGQGSSGEYWTSEYFGASSMYNLTINRNADLNLYGAVRYYGLPVRCVADI